VLAKNKLAIMLQKEMLPLSEKIFNYLSDYNDFIFHHLHHYLEGFSDEDVTAALDELEKNNLVEFQNFTSKEEDEGKPRKVDIFEVAGRKVVL
jgi:hypothetical protein